MARALDQLRADLMRLEEKDFDLSHPDAQGLEQLGKICDELAGQPVEVVAPLLLSFIERFAEPAGIDARYDLGTPGPLVHTLEALPGYEPWLIESIRRRPAPLSLLMLHRILNTLSEGEDYDEYLVLLRSVSERKDVSPATMTEAIQFLVHQQERRGGKNS
jgi:hypothetical protein